MKKNRFLSTVTNSGVLSDSKQNFSKDLRICKNDSCVAFKASGLYLSCFGQDSRSFHHLGSIAGKIMQDELQPCV